MRLAVPASVAATHTCAPLLSYRSHLLPLPPRTAVRAGSRPTLGSMEQPREQRSRNRFGRRVRAVPPLLERAPAWTVAPAAGALVVLGLLLVTRPLTSLVLLGVYVGVSCVLSGVADLLAQPPHWRRRVVGVVWTLAGVVVLVRLERTLAVLPVIAAVLLVVAGLGSLGEAVRGRLSARVLAGT